MLTTYVGCENPKIDENRQKKEASGAITLAFLFGSSSFELKVKRRWDHAKNAKIEWN